MRPGLKWSDGTPLTAKDFEYSVKRVADPKTASKYTAAVENLKNGTEIAAGKAAADQLGVKALDDSTVQFTLVAPTPFFPLLASTWSYFAMPQHVIEKFGDKWLEAGNAIASGPYMMKEWKHDQLQAFEINPNYWGPKPIVTRVECHIYPDATYLQPRARGVREQRSRHRAGRSVRLRPRPQGCETLQGDEGLPRLQHLYAALGHARTSRRVMSRSGRRSRSASIARR